MTDLVPQLRPISVSPEKLILDPNNPRLISKDEDAQPREAALDLLDQTLARMREDNHQSHYQIEELESSILQNGWLPVDFIFVQEFDNAGHYLVLEGNRRVTAIRNIRNNPSIPNDFKETLAEIEVMEVVDDVPEDQLREKITYLLGVRHHGSLVKWTPFARASYIYNRYMKKCTPDSFQWKAEVATKVADALSVKVKEVKERLRVYRAMEQIGRHPAVASAEPEAGIRDRYYSVCQEVVLSPKKSLNEYIVQDPETFLLTEDSVERMINLCHFDKPGRRDSPIANPQEWRKLGQILADDDENKRRDMLEQVEGPDKSKPSDVWAQRSAELQRLDWDTWLNKVLSVIKSLTLDDDFTSDEAQNTTKRLIKLIHQLEARDVS